MDLGKPFERLTMVDAVKKYANVDWNQVETLEQARELAKEHNIAFEERHKKGDILNLFFEEYVEEHLLQPTFIMDHPVEISPLTKKKPENPDYVEPVSYTHLDVYKRQPCTWFAPRCDGKEGPFKTAYDVMNNWGANHGAISYGHIGADLITLCSMLRIPVSMHNVPVEKIFRPAAWNAFGMDKEGADFRACKNYGPLYK